MESREIKGEALGFEITNEELFCAECNKWVNSVHFEIEMKMGQKSTTYKCLCGAIHEHS